MNVILTATDFSEIADNAVHYAACIASEHQCALVILHTYLIPLANYEVGVPVPPIDDIKDVAEKKINELIGKLTSEFNGLNVSGKVVYGDIQLSLSEYSGITGNMPSLVVVGNSSFGEHPSFFNTNLIPLMRNTTIPVLAVPPGVKHSTIQRIGFCYDNVARGSDLAISQLADMAQTINFQLHVLYVHDDVMNRDSLTDFEEYIKEGLKQVSVHYHIHYASTVEDEIKKFIAEYQLQWIAVMPRKHSFFESLFHRSHTKNLASIVNIPMLALHEHK
jgi:nucleotide-binding universal stress UspA family protein